MSIISSFRSRADLYNLDRAGKLIYQTNPHYHQIATIMEHPEFRRFYNQHFSDLLSLKVIMMFLKTYEEIEKLSSVELSPFQKIAVLKSVVDSHEPRRAITRQIQDFTKNNHIGNLTK